jgi:hypothetical protein
VSSIAVHEKVGHNTSPDLPLPHIEPILAHPPEVVALPKVREDGLGRSNLQHRFGLKRFG